MFRLKTIINHLTCLEEYKTRYILRLL